MAGNTQLNQGGSPVTATNPLPVAVSAAPMASAAAAVSAQTAAIGANFATFAEQACTALDIINNSAVDIEYQRGGAGGAIPVPANSARLVVGITDASQIGIRRIDQSGAQITIKAEALS